MNKKFKIAFFLSGKGSTLKNLLNFIQTNKPNMEIALVLSSKECLGIQIAKDHKIDTYNLNYSKYINKLPEYSNIITSYLKQYQIDYGIMGGFLSKYLVPKEYENKILNIHPSLIPAFSGKGFYGDKIYEAIFNSKVKISGITIQFVDSNYDTGPIIFQKSFPIKYYDTIEIIKDKANKLEKNFYPKIIHALINQKISVLERKVKIKK